MPTLLVIDDEPTVLDAVKTIGERSGFDVACAADGDAGVEAARAGGADLVMVDVRMPGVDGLQVLRAIHQAACNALPRRTHSHARPATSRLIDIDRWTLARPLLVGAVHGLAGSGALTALVVATLPSTTTRLGYLALFGVGSTLGMVALSGLLGWQIARMGSDRSIVRTFSLAVGSVSTVLGLFWGYPIISRLL